MAGANDIFVCMSHKRMNHLRTIELYHELNKESFVSFVCSEDGCFFFKCTSFSGFLCFEKK